MEFNYAGQLADEIVRQSTLRGLNRDELRDVLSFAPVDTNQFSNSVPENSQPVSELSHNLYHNFLVRRILVNRLAGDTPSFQPSLRERLFGSLARFSSDKILATLDENILDMMQNSEFPYSVLCKIRTCDFDNSYGTFYTVYRPVLIIPGVIDVDKVRD